jgi:hypothetical protein
VLDRSNWVLPNRNTELKLNDRDTSRLKPETNELSRPLRNKLCCGGLSAGRVDGAGEVNNRNSQGESVSWKTLVFLEERASANWVGRSASRTSMRGCTEIKQRGSPLAATPSGLVWMYWIKAVGLVGWAIAAGTSPALSARANRGFRAFRAFMATQPR